MYSAVQCSAVNSLYNTLYALQCAASSAQQVVKCWEVGLPALYFTVLSCNEQCTELQTADCTLHTADCTNNTANWAMHNAHCSCVCSWVARKHQYKHKITGHSCQAEGGGRMAGLEAARLTDMWTSTLCILHNLLGLIKKTWKNLQHCFSS